MRIDDRWFFKLLNNHVGIVKVTKILRLKFWETIKYFLGFRFVINSLQIMYGSDLELIGLVQITKQSY